MKSKKTKEEVKRFGPIISSTIEEVKQEQEVKAVENDFDVLCSCKLPMPNGHSLCRWCGGGAIHPAEPRETKPSDPSIQRYHQWCAYSHTHQMNDSESGEYVLYTDHQAAIDSERRQKEAAVKVGDDFKKAWEELNAQLDQERRSTSGEMVRQLSEQNMELLGSLAEAEAHKATWKDQNNKNLEALLKAERVIARLRDLLRILAVRDNFTPNRYEKLRMAIFKAEEAIRQRAAEGPNALS